jgi:DNA-binding transcriptional ArsR family regulator
MNQNNIDKFTYLFKALANPIRLKILMHMLQCKDHCHKHNISELSAGCEVDFSVVSRHLKALKDAGILSSKQSKNDVIYEVNRSETKELIKEFVKFF